MPTPNILSDKIGSERYMAKITVKEFVAQVSEEFLIEQGLELYDVEFTKEGKDWFLRVYIDKFWEEKEEFISLEDCEKVSRFISEKLDEADPIEQNYYLEVSSPGMGRTLKSEKDFSKYKGKVVEISLYEPLQGRKKYEGVLISFEDGNIVIQEEKTNELVLPIEKVAKTKLKVVL
jgi:ribosome maturation factor RimP